MEICSLVWATFRLFILEFGFKDHFILIVKALSWDMNIYICPVQKEIILTEKVFQIIL